MVLETDYKHSPYGFFGEMAVKTFEKKHEHFVKNTYSNRFAILDILMKIKILARDMVFCQILVEISAKRQNIKMCGITDLLEKMCSWRAATVFATF